MQLLFFEQQYLLQSIGWAVANSFWQIGSLWLFYQLVITIDKNLHSLVKYHLSLLILFSSFGWFIYTIIQNYRLLLSAPAELFYSSGTTTLLIQLQSINNALPVIGVIYLLFLVVFLYRFLENFSANLFIQRAGLTKAPVDVRLFTSNTALHLGIHKKVKVWLSEHVNVPCVSGYIKPVILLPVAIINHLTAHQVEAILLHELAHIKRNDYLVNLIQSIIVSVLFFNPFAVLISRAAKKERENCCDDWVMNFRFNQYDYAKALLILEEQRFINQPVLAMAATNGQKELLMRVKRLFNTSPQTYYNTLQKIKITGIGVLLLLVVFNVLPSIQRPELAKSGGNIIKPVTIQPVNKEFKNENLLKGKFSTIPLVKMKPEYKMVSKANIRRKAIPALEKGFVNAYINEDLLLPPQEIQPTATQVAEKTAESSTYFIKVEEQASGTKQTNTYYFELNNDEIGIEVKPLMIINKLETQENKLPEAKKGDSLKVQKKSVQPTIKKRITS